MSSNFANSWQKHTTGNLKQTHLHTTSIFYVFVLYLVKTRKPCYRKDDRAMHQIYGCPEKFRESSQTPPATFPEICRGLLFRSTLRMCTQNLKFVALSVPDIIGATQKIWEVPVYAHVPVSPKFLIGFCSYGPSEYICQI